MNLISSAFDSGELIPKRFGMDFENIHPPLTIDDTPTETISFVLIMEDPDVPAATGVAVWDHWVVFNIPPNTASIPEGAQPTGVAGRGTRGKLEYTGPRPPDREHRYFFKLYALDTVLDLAEGATKQEVLDATDGHILATAELMGRFAPT